MKTVGAASGDFAASGWGRVGFLLFAAAWGTNHFAPLLLLYRAFLHLQSTDLGVLFGVYAVGLVPGLLLGGPLSDRRGRRAVVLPSAIVALAGTAVLAAGASGFAVLLVGRLVVGVGSGATFSAGTAWLQDLSAGATSGSGARRATVALSCGFGGGPLIAALVAQWAPHPLLIPYLVQALCLAAALALAWRAPDGGGAISSSRSPSPSKVAAGVHLPAGFFVEIVPTAPWVFGFAAIAFVVLPGLIRDRLGSFAVIYAGVVTAATLLSGVFVQPLLRRITPRKAALIGLTSGSIGLLVAMAAVGAASAGAVLVAAVLLGIGYGACLIAGLRWVELATVPAIRGRVTGLFYLFTYVGFAAPFLLAAGSPHIGDQAGL
ncbi:MAG TPA: MFS transporter, partial [Polyangia bacterium]